MSSLLTHVAAGATLYFRQGSQQRQESRTSLVVLVLLAIAPDFDYLAIWLGHVHFEPRLTHSLLFCMVTSVLAWLVIVSRQARYRSHLGFGALLLAASSHLLLDLLVGRSLPLLWPFTFAEFSLPFAILPGAAHTGLRSYEFWRRLVLESGIVLPVAAAIVMAPRPGMLRAYVPEWLLGLTMWIGLVFCQSLTTL